MNGIITILLILENSLYLLFYLKTRRTFIRRFSEVPYGTKRQQWSVAFFWLLHLLRLPSRFPSWFLAIRRKVMVIYRCSADEADGLARWIMAEIMLLSFLVHDVTLLLAVVDGSSFSYAGIGLLLSAAVPFGRYRDLEHKWTGIKRSIVLELPDLLDKLTLLVNAGETVQGAIVRCADRKAGPASSRLYQELAQTRQEIANRVPFHRAMEDFSKRCSVQEVSIFTTTILMNYRRGGDELVAAFRELSRELWEKRKALARMTGEEASSKLVFPMIIIFIVVMVVIASPAVMIMSP